jgi:hypothetical protein
MMDEQHAANLADWAEHKMTLKPNSTTALRGPAAAEHGRSTLERALDEHHPAEPDLDHIAAQLDRARRGIAGEE